MKPPRMPRGLKPPIAFTDSLDSKEPNYSKLKKSRKSWMIQTHPRIRGMVDLVLNIDDRSADQT